MKKLPATFWVLLFSFLLCTIESCTNSQASQPEKKQDGEVYACLPCGNNCDTITYNKSGECPHCNMQLVKKSTITFKSIEANTICDYITKHPAAVLLDVRTPDEFEGNANPDFGTLKNAMNIPVQQLESRLPSISHLKNKEILVYCSHSHRSPTASYLLTQNGFTNVTNMNGGMSVVTNAPCVKR